MKEEQELQAREETRQRNQKRSEAERARGEELRRRERDQQQRLEEVLRRRGRPSLWARYGPYSAYAVLTALTLFVLLNSFSGDRRALSKIPVNDDTHILQQNEERRRYTLGRNAFFEGMTLEQAKQLAEVQITTERNLPRCNAKSLANVIPRERFSFYEQHPQCRFGEVQRKCASSYVEVPLAVLRSRQCARGEEFKASVDFAFACNRPAGRGCKGGQIAPTVRFMEQGVVDEECWNARMEGAAPETCPAELLSGCPRARVGVHCTLEGEDEIKRELQLNGPIVSVMVPYRDFFSYKSGVFEAAEQPRLSGLLAVKVVGWEEGAWLVEPLWGEDWGEQGLARVAMNDEDSLIEKFAYTLYPGEVPRSQAPAAAPTLGAAEQSPDAFDQVRDAGAQR